MKIIISQIYEKEYFDMIVEKRKDMITIDLTGPSGNAFALLGFAAMWARELGLDESKIIEEMKESDYEHLISVLDKYFGHFVLMER